MSGRTSSARESRERDDCGRHARTRFFLLFSSDWLLGFLLQHCGDDAGIHARGAKIYILAAG